MSDKATTTDEVIPARTFEKFVAPPYENLREIYTIETSAKENAPGTWNSTVVTIFKNHPDGTKEALHEYTRNYPGAKFEPFRQLQDGKWKHYALIAPSYLRVSVIDLETGEIIHEPWPTVTEKHHEKRDDWKGHEKWCEDNPIGKEMPGWSFCPSDFYVPDLIDYLDADTEDEYSTWINKRYHHKDDVYFYLSQESELLNFTGQFAIYSGCVWGDDTSMKVKAIDLSRLSEGIITTDDRFGYVELAGKLTDIEFSENGYATIPVMLRANIDTGKAWPIEGNWLETSRS